MQDQGPEAVQDEDGKGAVRKRRARTSCTGLTDERRGPKKGRKEATR